MAQLPDKKIYVEISFNKQEIVGALVKGEGW